MAADDATEAEFHQAIGEMVIRWNACEGHLRDIVVWLAGGRSVATLALTADLSAKAIIDTLPAITGAKSAEIREHCEWYAKGLDILRVHRNYYVHGISFIGVGMVSPEVGAWVSHVSGRAKVKITHERVGLGSLRALCDQMLIYSVYGSQLMDRADPYRGMFGSARRVLHGPWPNKPALPDTLRKPPPSLLGTPHQPES